MTWHLVLTSEDAKARRNRPSAGNSAGNLAPFLNRETIVLSLKAQQKRKIGHFKVQNRQKETKSRSLRGDVSKVMESFGQMLIVQFEECSELGGNVTVPQPTLSLKTDSL